VDGSSANGKNPKQRMANRLLFSERYLETKTQKSRYITRSQTFGPLSDIGGNRVGIAMAMAKINFN
jgi:hypothetical protein